MRFDPQSNFVSADNPAVPSAVRKKGSSPPRRLSRRTLAFVIMVSAVLGVWIWGEAGQGPGPKQSHAAAGAGSTGGLWDRITGSAESETSADESIPGESSPVLGEKARRAYDQGESAMASGRRSDALTRFAEAVRLEPKWAEARYKLGLIQVMSGYPDAARHELNALRELDPNLANLLDNLIP